jgi:hypothetical protein
MSVRVWTVPPRIVAIGSERVVAPSIGILSPATGVVAAGNHAHARIA